MSFNFNSFNSQPNFGFNSSRALPNFGSNFHNDNGQGFDFNYSNVGQNHVNYGQNELIPQRNSQPTIGAGQLGLSQRVSDVIRRNNFSPSYPRRVQVQSVIDYYPVENQPGVAEVAVTEVVKTKFLTSSASTRDRILAPNDHMISSSHQQPFLRNRNFLLSNQPNQLSDQNYESIYDSPSFLQNWSQNPLTTQNNNEQPFHNTFQNTTQNKSMSPSSTMSSQVNNSFPDNNDVPAQNILNQNPRQHQPNNLPVAKHDCEEILDPEPLSVLAPQSQNPSHDHDLVGDLIYAPRKMSEESSDDEDEDEEGDGVIHSLSRKKYGPYICPKCIQEFLTSQSFAAHVASAHYRFETAAERKKRLAAKYKKKSILRMARSSNGSLTIVHGRSFKNIADWRRKEKRAAVKIEDGDDQVQKQGEDGLTIGGIAVKEEALA